MKLKNPTLIFCNGDVPSRARLDRLVPHPAVVVCADGGARKARSVGYVPDLIVGDLDSLGEPDDLPARTEIIRIPTQDNTDFEKTLDIIIARGMNDILVVAFSGGRIDQTLANIQTAFQYSRKCDIRLADESFLLIPVSDSAKQRCPVGTTMSIVPMTDEAIVTTQGLEYELTGSVMTGGGHGISNRSVSDEVRITVQKGGILLLVQDA